MLVPKELVAWWVKHHSLRLHVLFNRKNNNNNNHTHQQEIVERVFEGRPEILKTAANLGLQYIESKLDRAVFGEVWRQKSYKAALRADGVRDALIAVNAYIIEYNNAVSAGVYVTVR